MVRKAMCTEEIYEKGDGCTEEEMGQKIGARRRTASGRSHQSFDAKGASKARQLNTTTILNALLVTDHSTLGLRRFADVMYNRKT